MRTLRKARTRRCVVLVAIAAGTVLLVGCQDDTPTVSAEQARTSFCAHGPSLGLALIGQPGVAQDPASYLEADAILYELAGEPEIAREVRAVADELASPVPAIRVFLDPALVSAAEEVEERLSGLPGVEEVRFVSADENHERFLEMFEDQPSIVENIDPNAIPASFDVTFVPGTDVDAMMERVPSGGGIREVVAAGPQADASVVDATVELVDAQCPGLRDRLGPSFPSG